jgi:hypothetical protein
LKILITGGNSAVAIKIHKAFKGEEVLLADYGEVPQISSPNYQLASLGAKNLDITAHTLLSFCLDNAVDILLPLYHFEFEAVAKAKTLFEEFGITILLPEVDQLGDYLLKPSKTDFVVLNNGTLVYKNFDKDIRIDMLEKSLSGAFYIQEVDDLLTYSLISID